MANRYNRLFKKYLVIMSSVVAVQAMGPAKPGVTPSPKVIEYQLRFAQTYRQGGLAAAVQRIKASKSDASRNVAFDTLHVQFPVLLGNYADAGDPAYPAANLQTELFDGPWSTPTMREHYLEMSYGQFHLSGQVYGWYPMSQGHAYYEGSQSEPYDNGFVNPPGGVGSFLRETLTQADSTVDFSQYDNDGSDGIPNSGDDDGYVDACFFVHSGRGGEGGGPSIWSHRSRYASWWGASFQTNDSSANGGYIRVNDYIVQPALSSVTAGMIEIGVFSHEFGHAIGLPDLYDTDYSSDGIGNWGLMGGGSWNTPSEPAHMSAWCKEVLGWITPVLVTENLDSVAIPDVETQPYLLKLWRNGQPEAWTSWFGIGLEVGQEYFLVENRQRIGTDVHLVGTGLLIWHIDNSRSGNSNDTHRLVDMKAADGTFGNGASPGDPWPGTTNNRNFDFETIPPAVGWDGTNTEVAILNISDSDTTMQADLEVHEITPHLALQDYEIFDENGDGILAPGETFELWINLRNTGGPATGIEAELSTTTDAVIITSGLIDFPELDFMDSGMGTIPFELLVSDSAQTSLVRFTMRVTSASNSDTITTPITIGIGFPAVGLVDNDGNTNNTNDVRQYFSAALDSLALVYKVWDVASAGQPDSTWLNTKPVIIWFTGNVHSPLTSQTISNLADFLDNGGRLLISGQHAGDSFVQFPDFFRDYLGCELTNYEVQQDYVFGRDGEAGMTSQDRFLINAAAGAHNQNGTDAIAPFGSGQSLFYYPFLQASAGVYQNTAIYRSMYLGFGFEAISSLLGEGPQTRENLLGTLLDWLQMPTTSIGYEDDLGLARNFTLRSVYPNPFNPSVYLAFSVPSPASSRINIYDITGRRVADLGVPRKAQGLTWTPNSNLASGLYFIQLWQPAEPVGKLFKLTYLK